MLLRRFGEVEKVGGAQLLDVGADIARWPAGAGGRFHVGQVLGPASRWSVSIIGEGHRNQLCDAQVGRA